MRYHNITHDDMKNGDGLRVVLWVSGCNHHCAECHNPITWDHNEGLDFTYMVEDEDGEVQEEFMPEPLEEIEAELRKPWVSGITLSGGDPLYPLNREVVGKLIKYLKGKYPTKTVWVYTGFELTDDLKLTSPEETFEYEYLPYIDILVDGRFKADIRKSDIESGKNVPWRGSSNQRVIDIQKTLEIGEITMKKEVETW